MTDVSALQSLSTYPVGSQPTGIEEITVKAKKPDEGFSFWDFLDVINPLQHIPVVNTIYREMTGDEIKPASKMIGGAILGGPIGLGVAMVDTVIEDSTGKDMGGHAMALFQGDDTGTPSTQTASVQTATTQSSAREFIPAPLATLPSAVLSANSILEKEDEEPEAVPPPEETEAAIAAAAAAAPQGMVFMPLPGRQKSQSFSALNSAGRAEVRQTREFMPIKEMNRTSTSVRQNTSTANPSTVAQFRAQAAAHMGNQMGDLSGVPSRKSVLDLTKP